MPGVLSIEGKRDSGRISKKVSLFSYASGSQPNPSRIGHFDQGYRSSPDFPLPSVLLGNEDPFEYDLKRGSEVFPPKLSYDEFQLSAVTDTASTTESFRGNCFESNAFEALEGATQARKLSSNKKRPVSPSVMEPKAKLRCLVADEDTSKVVEVDGLPKQEAVPELETEKPLPDWVAELDQDLIAFFGDSVVYKD